MHNSQKLICAIRDVFVAALIMSACSVSASVFSCRTNGAGFAVTVLSGDFSAPELRSFSAENAGSLLVGFSEAISAVDLHITTSDNNLYADGTRINAVEDPKLVALSLSKKTVRGEKYLLTGAVSDAAGNSLSFSLAFSGYNDEVPRLALSEVRSEYSKPKCEFIELYAVTGGNLAGVTLYSAYDGIDCLYEFPACAVAAGEYLVVHYRKIEDGALDETGDNLKLSTCTDSSDARDFWVDNREARIGKSDVILLRERDGGALLDALWYAESGKTTIKNVATTAAVAKAAEEAFNAGLWPGGVQPENAVCSDGATYTRTISRQNIARLAEGGEGEQNGKAVWQLTASSGASPGKPNSSAIK